MTKNQMNIVGAKALAIFRVPKRCTVNKISQDDSRDPRIGCRQDASCVPSPGGLSFFHSREQ